MAFLSSSRRCACLAFLAAVLARPAATLRGSFCIGDGSGAGTRVHYLQQEVLKTAVNNYYNTLAKQGLSPELGRNIELVDGRLRLKAYPNINIVNTRTGRPKTFDYIAGKEGGGAAIRQELGFPNWTRRGKQKLPAAAVETLSRANREFGEVAGSMDTVELRDLGQTANEASGAFHNLETTFTDTRVDELLETINDPPLNLCEIRGLDRALKNIRGELTNNLAKLMELDRHIALERRKLGEDSIDEFTRRRIAERLRELQDEIASRLEAAAANREASALKSAVCVRPLTGSCTKTQHLPSAYAFSSVSRE